MTGMPYEDLRPGYCRCGCGEQTNLWHGKPLTYRKGHHGRRSLPLRLWEKVDFSAGPDGCWLWIGARQVAGYGCIRLADDTFGRVHRVAYELLIGPIPEGLHIDHLCSTPSCVNPSHMEPVTDLENNRRRDERTTSCARGHDWTDPANVYVSKRGRSCRPCTLDAQRERRRLLREAS